MVSGKSIVNLFRCLDVNNVVVLFKCAMLE